MAVDLSRVKEREALHPRREPYWQRLRPGCLLGYRPSAREGAGGWIARAYDDVKRSYRLQAIGDFGDLPAKDRFAEAKKEAEAYSARLDTGSALQVNTVADVCRRYAKVNKEAAARFTRYIYRDPISGDSIGEASTAEH